MRGRAGKGSGADCIAPSSSAESCRPRSCCPSTMWLFALVLVSLATSTVWGEFFSCVSLGKVLHSPVPQFPPLVPKVRGTLPPWWASRWGTGQVRRQRKREELWLRVFLLGAGM